MLVSIFQIKNLKFVRKLYLISKIPIQRSNLNPLPFERHLEPYFDKSSQREGRFLNGNKGLFVALTARTRTY